MNDDQIPELEIGQRFRFKFGDPRFLFELRNVTVTDGTDFEMTGVVIDVSGQDFVDADGHVVRESIAISDGPRRLASVIQAPAKESE